MTKQCPSCEEDGTKNIMLPPGLLRCMTDGCRVEAFEPES